MAMEAMPSEFNYFSPLAVQSAIEEEYDQSFAPVATLERGNPIEFSISGADNLYRDLNNSYLVVKCKITQGNGANLAADTAVAPTNLLLHSLFKSIDVYVNGVLVNHSDTLYAFRAYLETILGYSQDVLETRAITEGFVKDDADKMDAVILAAADRANPNSGFVARNARIALSASITLVGRPHCDLFHQGLDIPPGVTIGLKLTMNADPFVLMAAAGSAFRVEMQLARMYVRTKRASKSLVMAHLQMLKRSNARIPFNKVQVKTAALAGGQQTFELANLFTAGTVLPNRIVVAMVTNAALAGAYETNPFRFRNFGITSIGLSVNARTIPADPLTMNHATGDYQRAYISMLGALGMDAGNRALAISPAAWSDGYNIYAFKLAPGPVGGNGGVISTPETGNVTLKLTFAAALAQDTTLIIYSEAPALLEIDQFGKVISA